MDPSIDPSSLLSDTLIVAVKGNGFALLGADSLCCNGDLSWMILTDDIKTYKLHDNIFMAESGHVQCIEALRKSVEEDPCQSTVRSVADLARFVKNRIDNKFRKIWNDRNQYLELFVVGNMAGTDKYQIIWIYKSGTSYKMVEVMQDTMAIGSGATQEIKELLGQLNKNDSVETATRHVFDVLRECTVNCWGVGGDLRVINFRKDFAIMSVVEQEDPGDCTSPYTTRTDTIMDPRDSHQLSVTYNI